MATYLLIVGACALASSCGPATIWSAESWSPDGLWRVSAHTLEYSGFGAGGYVTEVYLKRTNVWRPAQEILSFSHDPSLESPQSGATINLRMRWPDPKHLEVMYDGHAGLGFQVVRFADIDISVRDISAGTTDAPR